MTAPAPTQEKALTVITKYLDAEIVKNRFASVVGSTNAGAYISSAMLAVANSEALQKCTPESIYTSALRAATLRLSVDPSLGQAYLVPYGGHATLIVGYKGLYDMAVRTGHYTYINVGPIYDGQVVEENQMTGFHSIVGLGKGASEYPGGVYPGGRRKIIGWIGAFQMTSKFGSYGKTFYMTVEDIHAHAKKYSKSYTSGPWQTETDKMERKTVLRLFLRRWGYLDPADVAALEELESAEPAVDAIYVPEVPEYEDGVEAPKHSREQNLRELGFETPASVNDPAPAVDAAEWPTESLQVLVNAGLAKNEFAARGMLGLSNLTPGDPADIIKLWGTMYREKRGTKPTKDSPTSQEAADYANVALPRPS